MQQAAEIPEEPSFVFVMVQLNGIYTPPPPSANEASSDLLQLLQLRGLRGVSGGVDENWNG